MLTFRHLETTPKQEKQAPPDSQTGASCRQLVVYKAAAARYQQTPTSLEREKQGEGASEALLNGGIRSIAARNLRTSFELPAALKPTQTQARLH